ncbi:hypothetical protein JMJ76_0007611 [Colletotrichum scovillei]|nr:hypothetical protein JMJ76_0007611 [Colletotrichum scovillei]
MLVPELYRNVSIHGYNSFQKLKCFIQFLINNKDIASNIRSLYLHLDPSNTETKNFTEADLEWSHWAARQSGAPSPYYLWHSEDGKLLQMSESRRSRTRILHLGILLEIVLSRVHGVQELGLAVPGGLFCDQYGPWSRNELDGLLWRGEPGPSDPLKIQTFRGVQQPLPNIKMLAIRPSCLPKNHPDTTITPLDLNHLLHFAPNARSIFIASRDAQPASPLDTHSQWSNVTCLTITETFLDEQKIRGMIQGCASLVSFKYLNSRADTYVPHWPVSPEEIVTILREHQNTTTTLLTLCFDLNDWYRGEYEAIRSLSDFSNLESLWVDASTVLKKVKYGSFSRSEKHKRLTHKLSTSFPASIKRLHLADFLNPGLPQVPPPVQLPQAWLKKASLPAAMHSFNTFELSSAVLFTLVNNAQDFILSAEPLSLSGILDAIHDMDEIVSTQQTNKSTMSSLKSFSMRKTYTDAESHWAWPRERLFNARFIDGAKNLKESYIIGTALQFHNWSSTHLTTLAFNDSSMPLGILANAIRACPRLERFFWKKPIRRDMHPYAVHPWLILGALGIRRATIRTLVIDFNGTCETDLQSPAFELSTFTRLEEAWVDISVFESNKANFTDASSDPLNPTVVEGSPLIRTLPPSLRKLHISGSMNDFIFDEVLWLTRPRNHEPRHVPAEFALDGGYLDGDMFKLWDYRNDYEHIPTADLDPQPFLW